MTILTRSAYRLRLDGKSSIWRLRQFFDGQSHVTRYPQVRISAGVSPYIQAYGEALMTEGNNLSLFGKIPSKRSR